ncbi:MAG: hypothetical protein EU539_06710 [Promethearchaeota archaeon]|nr:MAG: hypothetical protein EU539_06710 [Candidatus Lokiarchaeota archaeon]
MDKKKYYKYLFIIGGIFNWAMAVSFISISILDPHIFTTFGSSYPPTLFFLHSLLGLIFTYGIGYVILGLDIDKNQGIAILGVISKLCFFMFCVIYFLLGDLFIIIVIFGSMDFIFACLFIEFLINYKKRGE